MSFTRVNPPGWALNDPLTSAQINQLDTNVSRAGDFTNGGIYTPGAVIQINGAGFGGLIQDSTLESGQTITVNGSIIPGSTGRVGRRQGSLADGDADLVASIDSYRFTVVPSVPRTYTVRHTGTVPITGNRILVTMTLVNATADAIFEREDATELCRIAGGGNGGAIELEFMTANKWWCVAASGDGNVTVPHS